DLTSGNYRDAAGLILCLAPDGTDIASLLNGSINGLKWTGCTLDLSTYKVSESVATLVATFSFKLLSTGQTADLPTKVTFSKAGHDWKISDMKALNS
ncbi:MAG: hypothetical protein ACXWQ5_18740, partial [Ktedonobacterales bacterium]